MKPSSSKLATIVLADRGGTPTCPSTAIAEHCGIQHKNVLELIDKHADSIESAFGHVAFETRPFETGGGIQRRRIAFLTEQQATFLITMFRNTDVVVRFKLALKRTNPAAVLLALIIGLLVGWLLRDGGALLP